MIVKQNLSILFYHKKKKSRIADSKAPIYVRVTIDGLDDEISTPNTWASLIFTWKRRIKMLRSRMKIRLVFCFVKNMIARWVQYCMNRSLSPALVAAYETCLPDKRLLQQKLMEIDTNKS